MADYKVLVPFNLTMDDERSLEFVVQLFLGNKEVSVNLFFAYTPIPDLDMQNNPVMARMAKNIAYRRQNLLDQEAELERVKERLTDMGFGVDRVRTLFLPLKKDVARDILGLVRDKGFNALVLTRHPGSITRFFSRSVSAKVSGNLSSNVQLFFVN